jgi:hypothetical protein
MERILESLGPSGRLRRLIRVRIFSSATGNVGDTHRYKEFSKKSKPGYANLPEALNDGPLINEYRTIFLRGKIKDR